MTSRKPARLIAAVLASGAAAAAVLTGASAAHAAPQSVAATTQTTATTVLKTGQRLLPGQSIKSPNGVWTLQMEKYGDVTLSRAGYPLVWAAGRTKAGSVLVFQKNGDLQVVWGRTVVWSSGTDGSTNATLRVGNAGELTLYNSRGKAAWNRSMVMVNLFSDDVLRSDLTMYSHNRLYRLQMQKDGNLQLLKGTTVLWQTKTGGHPGAYVLWANDGDLTVLSGEKQEIWSSKTGRPGSVLQLRDDGKLAIIYGRTTVWTAP